MNLLRSLFHSSRAPDVPLIRVGRSRGETGRKFVFAAFAALALFSAIGSAFAQAPAPVPALPDTPRFTTYSLSGSTCTCSVSFALYGDSTDVQNWVTVWINEVQIPQNGNWLLSSPTGPLSTIPRPITDAVLTFTIPQTGTVRIEGAQRPRRLSQFSENQGVSARSLNQAVTTLVGEAREAWDRQFRTVMAPAGETLNLLPAATARANQGACFDSLGNLINCVSIPSSTFIAGQGILFTGTNPTTISTVLPVTFRTKLSAPTTFNVATTGVDQVGCGLGTGTSACRTRAYLYNVLASNYDFGNQTVTVQIADGTYTDSMQAQGPLIVGQSGGNGLIFTGNCTTPANVLIQPAGGAGYAYSADSGISYRIQCQKLDQTGQRSVFPSGADIVVAGHGSRIYFGNSALLGVRQDVIFGCNFNGFNAVTAAFGAYVEWDNDFGIDVGLCQETPTGTVTSGSANITSVSSTTGVEQGMGVVATGIPPDAYVGSFSTGTISILCIVTSPCQATSSPGAETITLTGGGQAFLDMGNGATGYFATNGDPDASILGTLGNFPFYHAGWFFINEGSTINAQAITWVNPGQARGACSVVKTLSNIDTNLQGIPYLPCASLAPIVSQSGVSVTAGANTITVTTTAGILPGMSVADVVAPTATWTAGSPTIVVSSGTGILVGAKVTGPGILTGAVVTNVAGTTITIGGCGAGTRCVSGNPTYLSESGQTVFFTNGLIAANAVVVSTTATTVLMTGDQPLGSVIKASGSVGNVWFEGQVYRNSVYD